MTAFLYGFSLGIVVTLGLLVIVVWLLTRGSNRGSVVQFLHALSQALKERPADGAPHA